MFLHDLRSAARSVSRARALTAVVVVTLGIGTGANVAVFSVVRSLLFRAPAGIVSPGSLATIFTSQYDGSPYGPSSLLDFLSIPQSVSTFTTLAAVDDGVRANASLGDHVQLTRVSAVSPQFFVTLGLEPHAGRFPTTSEIQDRAPVAVVSFDLWQSAGSPDLAGLKLTIPPRIYRVVGVAPRGFRGLVAARFSDVWLPLRDEAAGRGDRRLAILARLARGQSVDRASRQLETLSETLAAEFPETNRGAHLDPEAPRLLRAVRYSPLAPEGRTQAAVIAAIITGAVVLLLVSACLNAGTLLLSRGFARRRELAVKMALGAQRPRLMRQLILESLLLALGGAALGVLFASWTMSVIPSLFAPEQAAMLDTSLPPALIAATLGVSAFAGALFGIAPAFHASSASAVLALRADAGGVSEQQGGKTLRSALVGVQLAVSTVLLLATALLVNALGAALNADAAYLARNIAIVSLKYPGNFIDPLAGNAYHAQALAQLRKQPEVNRVGWTSVAPLTTATRDTYRIDAGMAETRDSLELEMTVVSGDYFAVSGAELLEGRLFTAADQALSDPVAILEERLARRYFGNRAVGHSLLDSNSVRYTIVGVIRPKKYRTLQDESRMVIYYPLTQHYQPQGHLLVELKTEAAPALTAITRVLTRVDEGVDIQRVLPFDRHLGETLTVERLTTTLVGICGVLALVMAVIGAYGVMTDAVQRRTREIGLRVALGAARHQVALVVFRDVSAVLAAGVAGGVVLSLAVRQVIAMSMSNVPGFDAGTLAAAPLLLSGIIALAAVLPLRRALSVNASIALRAE